MALGLGLGLPLALGLMEVGVVACRYLGEIQWLWQWLWRRWL